MLYDRVGDRCGVVQVSGPVQDPRLPPASVNNLWYLVELRTNASLCPRVLMSMANFVTPELMVETGEETAMSSQVGRV